MKINKLLGLEVSTSEHSALNRESVDQDNYFKVIIFGVDLENTEDEICEETGAESSKRLLKKDQVGTGRIATETVILTFLEQPPKEVWIG